MYIPYKFIALNNYINKERSNRYAAAKIKKQETNAAYMYLVDKQPIKTPCKLRFKWYVKDKRSDPDNIAFSKKFILDSMVKAQIIPNDNLNHITELHDIFIIDKDKIGVEIEIY